MELARPARNHGRLRLLLLAVPLALIGGLYLRWALPYGTDIGAFTIAWRTLTSAHAVRGLGFDDETFYSARPGHLHLYDSVRDLHFGPLSLPWGALPRGPEADHLSQGLGLLLGVVACGLLWTLARSGGPAQRRAGAVMVLGVGAVWVGASVRYVHPDVTMTALLVLLAALAVRRGQARRAGVLFGLACAASLTAGLFLPILFALDRGRRVAFAWAAGIAAAFWLPFVVAAPSTLRYLDAADQVTGSTIWGVVAGPSGAGNGVARLVQGLVCLAAGTWLLSRRDVPRALVVVGLLRVALDSAGWSYLLLLLVMAGVVADLLQRSDFGARNTLACLAVAAAPVLGSGSDLATCVLRLCAAAGALVVVLRPYSPCSSRSAAEPTTSGSGRPTTSKSLLA